MRAGSHTAGDERTAAALTITATVAHGVAGSASSQAVVEKWDPATGTWVSVST